MKNKSRVENELEGQELKQKSASVFKWVSIWFLFLVVLFVVLDQFGWAHPLSGFAASALVFVFLLLSMLKKAQDPQK
ncbi:hypothetical protein [Vibrio parahaemolyticus]|uniref:hypothetical protein n=1 Tax=Vibrio parahaemolyticus TaxID=670 RepID=UPI0021522BEF|nr:hypothetical protein [Vibrio parahaemolyticus]